MESRILNVKVKTATYWQNGKCAEFHYYEKDVCYQLVELTDDGKKYIVPTHERTLENCPVIALGFVAYLIHNWGKTEKEIYLEYYDLCLSKFLNIEDKKSGSINRDLNAEYYKLHVTEQKGLASKSEKIYPYLTDNDSKLIKQYEESYFDFIRKNYNKYSDYSDLLNALSKYIIGISNVEFTNIIEHHSLTPGAQKAIWKGKPVDAHRFTTFTKMKLPDFNKCFSFPDGKTLMHNDKDKQDKDSPIIEILTAHLNK